MELIDFVAWFVFVWALCGLVTWGTLVVCYLVVVGSHATDTVRVRRSIIVDSVLWPLTWLFVIPLFVKRYRKDRKN